MELLLAKKNELIRIQQSINRVLENIPNKITSFDKVYKEKFSSHSRYRETEEVISNNRFEAERESKRRKRENEQWKRRNEEFKQLSEQRRLLKAEISVMERQLLDEGTPQGIEPVVNNESNNGKHPTTIKELHLQVADRVAQDSEDQCILCVENAACIKSTACSHKIMCFGCMKKLAISSTTMTCPVCRTACTSFSVII